MNTVHTAHESIALFAEFCKGKTHLLASKSTQIQTITTLPLELTQLITSFNPFFPVTKADETTLTTSAITWIVGEGKEEICNNFALIKEADGLQAQNEELLQTLAVEVRACLQRVGVLGKKALLAQVPDLTQEGVETKLLAAIEFNLLGRIEDDMSEWNKTNPNFVCATTEEYLFPANSV